MQHVQDDRSLGELFAELSNETSRLVRQEVALAKKELGEKVSHAGKDVGFIVAGALIAYAGFVVFLGFAVIGLYIVTHHWWLSALVVALVVMAAGGFLIMTGKNNLAHEDMTPHRTIESLRQDGEMVKQEAR